MELTADSSSMNSTSNSTITANMFSEGDDEDEDFDDDQLFSASDSSQPYYYDSAKEMVKSFACSHSFHIRCLKKHYKQKGDELEEVFNRKVEKLRCPTCNLKNYDIDAQETKSKGFQRGAKLAGAVGSRFKDIAIQDRSVNFSTPSKSNSN